VLFWRPLIGIVCFLHGGVAACYKYGCVQCFVVAACYNYGGFFVLLWGSVFFLSYVYFDVVWQIVKGNVF